jgi:hypothetical protein
MLVFDKHQCRLHVTNQLKQAAYVQPPRSFRHAASLFRSARRMARRAFA